MSNKQELKRLQTIWYKKLKRDDFNDIEKSEDWLKNWSSTSQGKKSLERKFYREDTGEYFRLVGHFLWDHNFESDLERRVWELHAEGHYARHISKVLRPEFSNKKLNKDNVQAILTKLSNLMKEAYKFRESYDSE